MSGGTVSNHDTIIATKGTPHLAKAKPATADHCFDPTKKPVVFGDNKIYTYQLGTGKPTKTFIANKPPWTANGWIDEAPSWPAHAGVGGGVKLNVGKKGLNYIQYAYPTSWSQDVKVEGHGVVRTNDTTKQNGGNCDGYVDGSELKQWQDSADDLMKKKCTIKKVTGKCKHGRELGAPPNADKGADGFYLDVLGGDTVTIEADRKDISDAAKEVPPTCAAHTYWYASRTGSDGDVKKDFVGDKFEISGDLLKDPMPELSNPLSPSVKIGDEKNGLTWNPSVGVSGETRDSRTERRKDAVQTAQARSTTEGLREIGSRNNVVTLQETSKRETDAKARAEAEANKGKPPPPLNRDSLAKREEEKVAKVVKTAETAAGVAKLLAQLYMQWQFERNPPVVNVTAVACSGAKHVKLRVFPAADVTYSIPAEPLQKLFDRLHSLGNMAKMVRDKLKVETKFEFLKGFSLEFAIGFKELTANKNGRFKTEVRRAWNLGLKIEKVIYLYAEGQLSVIQILGNAIFPGIGTILDEVAAIGGFTCSGFLSGEVTLGIQLSAGFDEYFEGSVNGSEASLVGTVKLGLKCEYDGRAGHFKAWANTIWENTIKATNFRNPDTPECWCLFDVVGYIQLGAEAGYVADLFNWNRLSRATIGIKGGNSVTWKPEYLKWPKGDATTLGTFRLGPPKA